jgi:hypothetical protein
VSVTGNTAASTGVGIGANSVLENSIIRGNTTGGETNGVLLGGTNAQIRNSVIYNFSRHGDIGIYSAPGFELIAYAYNCTIFNCRTGMVASHDNRLVSVNSVVMDSISSDFGARTYTAASKNNISSDTTAPGDDSLTEQDEANVFTNSGGADFSLKTGSVAIDVGTTIAAFDYDIIDTSRPQGLIWDVGAFERE